MKKRYPLLSVAFAFLGNLFGFPSLQVLPLASGFEIEQIDSNLNVIRGGGGNSAVLVTSNAVVVIDTKLTDAAADLYNYVKHKAGSKKIIVINTHYHGDHTGGNHLYKGSSIYIGAYDKTFLAKQLKPENMPTDFVSDSLSIDLGDETLVMYNLGQAHTFNDMVVYLQNRRLLFTGDIIFAGTNPFVKAESGANVDKWLSCLDILLTRWDVTTYFPGHGPSGGKSLAENLSQYFLDMKIAAADKSREPEITSKYRDWQSRPGMASPEITIDFIRSANGSNSKK